MRRTLHGLAAVAILGWGSAALAKPIAPSVFCSTYPSSPVCAGGQPACTFCHTTPPARNELGAAIAERLLPGTPRPLTDQEMSAGLPEALRAIETEDTDGDGATNLDEILAGTYPADKNSVPGAAGCPASGANNGGYDVCNWDPRYVFEKVHLDFCGTAPTHDRLAAFELIEDKNAEIHDALDRCLDSEYWLGKDGALYRIAHRKIKPVQSIKSGENAGDIPLGNYDDDYKLFVYTQIDNHDARELLTARYFVEATATPPKRYTTVSLGPFQELQARGAQEAQLVEIEKRAGLLTTRWNFVLNTMFTPIPRTTAAQAYRAYLGLDIARMEGLQDVAGEPQDFDQKGVQAEACARCHATLDPLTYPFTRYAGFTGGIPFTYAPDRMNNLAQGRTDPLRQTPERGVIFGTPVNNLVEWASVAANSEAFARATVLDYWKHLFREPPRPTEQVEYDRLWRDFMTRDSYGVERMLHALIETEAYGVP